MRRFLVVALTAPFLVLPLSSAASAACARVPSDFNGDGYGDLAVGAPRTDEEVDGVFNQGAVHVAYGSAAGIGKGAGSVSFDGRSPGLPDGQFRGSSRLGEALASGYFDGDCYADLAVSAASTSNMLVLYGSPSGLTPSRSAAFDRNSIQPDGEYPSAFSYSLAAADFNGDGFDDIAAGAPQTDEYTGAFGVLYGAAGGITATGAQWIDQDSPSVPGGAEKNDSFGQALAAGDFNGDGRAELAVGTPGEANGSRAAAGGVIVFPGTGNGLATAGSVWWDQDSPDVPGGVEANDWFGDELAAGDTNGDGRAELVVAAPQETVGTASAAGMVHVFRGTASGLAAGPAFDQNHAQIPGTAESGDYFGSALALVDFNRDGKRDLIVGVRGESAGSVQAGGAVNVLFSSASGPSATGSLYVDQNSAGVPGANEDNDGFGTSLGRISNASGGESLTAGAPDEKVTYNGDGAVTVLPGAAGTTRPEGLFLSGGNFPRGAVEGSNFGAGLS